MKNYYKILNINKNATLKQIKKAYKQLALIYHPDRNKNNNSDEKFKLISEAYEILSNKNKRAMYDLNNNHEFDFESPIKLFNQLFPSFDKNIFQIINNIFDLTIKKKIKYKSLEKINNYFKKFNKFLKNNEIYNLIIFIINQNNQNNTLNNPPLIYNIEYTIEELYNFPIKIITINTIDKCFICLNKKNNLCNICNNNIYYIKKNNIKINLHNSYNNFKNLGNYLPNSKNRGDLIIKTSLLLHNKFIKIKNHLVYLKNFKKNNIKFNITLPNSDIVELEIFDLYHNKLIQIPNKGFKNNLNQGNLYILFKKINYKIQNYSGFKEINIFNLIEFL